MIVYLRPFGALERHLGGGRLAVELAAGATLGDLYHRIGECWGPQLPDSLWDGAGQRFRGLVVIMSRGVDLNDPATPLADGQEISLIMPLAGG